MDRHAFTFTIALLILLLALSKRKTSLGRPMSIVLITIQKH